MIELVLNTQDREFHLIGGKAQRLLQLSEAGFDVPKLAVIPCEQVYHIVEAETKNVIDQQWVSDLFKLLQSDHIAVRSAGMDEDGENHSYAGQFETVLNVSSTSIYTAIDHVIRSGNSERIQAYREQKGITSRTEISIILQKMINPEISGVVFTKNPNPEHVGMIANVCQGLGDKLVSGEISGEQIDLNNLENSEILSPEQIKTLRATCKKVEQYFDSPQDIEFCFENDKLWILQSREITTLDKETRIWDNSNIIESFPGITLPLTFSFILKVYEQAYWQLLTLLGAPKSDLQSNKNVFATTLGHLNGRVYYNLYAWYKMLSLLPGYSLNHEFMEKMMGVKETFVLPDYKPMSGLKAWYNLLRATFKILTNLAFIKSNKNAFLTRFHHELKAFSRIDLRNQSTKELLGRYRDFEKRILSNWKAPLVNDFFTMIFFGAFQKVLAKDNIEHLHNDLLVGSRDIISVEPVKRIHSIIHAINNEDGLNSTFISDESSILYSKIKKDYPKIYQLITNYIKDFGNRCGEELKLETHTFETHPEKFIDLLKSQLSYSSSKPTLNHSEVRLNAEKEALEKTSNKRLFRFMLKKTRTFVSNRENLRYERTKAFSIARKIYRQIGANFMEDNRLDHADDIFYLTMEEADRASEDKLLNLKTIVETKKEQFKVYENMHLPERVTTINGIIQPTEFKEFAPEDQLAGIGCCPGIVRGKVLKLTRPTTEVSLQGRILLARSTDPGWVTLFAAAQALVVERGSLLSHSAIVAREMGVPCVVNIPHLFDRFEDGQEIEINGSTGTVTLISKQ